MSRKFRHDRKRISPSFLFFSFSLEMYRNSSLKVEKERSSIVTIGSAGDAIHVSRQVGRLRQQSRFHPPFPTPRCRCLLFVQRKRTETIFRIFGEKETLPSKRHSQYPNIHTGITSNSS